MTTRTFPEDAAFANWHLPFLKLRAGKVPVRVQLILFEATDAMALDAVSESLLQRMINMTAGDISVLEAASKQAETDPNARMVTDPGSNNDKLWTQMGELGWMIGQDEELVLNPSREPLIVRSFRITEQGRQPIATLLDAHLNRRFPQARSTQTESEPMPRRPWLASGICEKFVARLCEQISSQGGDASDVIIMLARVVLLAMRSCVATSSQPEVIDRLCLVTKQRVATIGESRIKGVPVNYLTVRQPTMRYAEEQLTKLTSVHNQNCPQFVAELVKQVREGGGKPNDLMFAVAVIVAICFRAAIRPELRDSAVENVFGAVKKMLPSA